MRLVAEESGLLVGLEVHQQLSCSTKLFCACPPAKSEEFPHRFERRLRPAQSETGRVDPAAVFEFAKGKSNAYFWNPESSCLVEADEEPPHPVSREALEGALLAATALGSNIVDEVHVMRKIVIDGSNTGGFQRTAVVGLGGSFEVDGAKVGVQSVTLEEDAARILGEDASSRRFALDRLGVALVEVALEPIRGDPGFVEKVALHLGRVLRSTGRVARGLGTIRQDLNISFAGGSVVEVKGVQKLNLLPKVVDYEGKRQRALVLVAEKLRERGVRDPGCRTRDVTPLLAQSSSGAIRRSLAEGGSAVCMGAAGFAGLLGWEPEPGVRLGKELAEVARANSLGGVIHSDEFGVQGVTEAEAAAMRNEVGMGDGDALVLLAGPRAILERVAPLLESRIRLAAKGVPAETRAATDSGETRYMRPRPGSQRMYPETDIPDIKVTHSLRRRLRGSVPEPWTSLVERLQSAYSLSADLALKLYDSESAGEFERLAAGLELERSFIASVLVDLPARLAREGVPERGFTTAAIEEALRAVAGGRAAKEAVPAILERIGREGVPLDDAIRSLGLATVSESQVAEALDALLAERSAVIKEKGDSAFSVLMGEAMRELRGRADGSTVARLLRERIDRALGK